MQYNVSVDIFSDTVWDIKVDFTDNHHGMQSLLKQ